MITEEELRKQAKQAERELIAHKENTHKKKNFTIWALAMALLIVAMIVPATYFGKYKSPSSVPSLEEIQKMINEEELEKALSIQTRTLETLKEPNSLSILIATKIATNSCEGHRLCQAKAIYQFVRDEISYRSDPSREYYESPIETLMSEGSDCDGQSILLANLLESIGFYTAYEYTPNHVHVKMLFNDAPGWYKDEDGWIHLDATCKSCEFGKTPR